MRICDLRQREVINSCDCKRLGYVCDVDINIHTGCIIAIIVPGPAPYGGIFGRDSEYVIPFECVCQIGPDIILVQVDEKKVLVKC